MARKRQCREEQTNEIGNEEEDVFRIRLSGGEIDSNFGVDDADGLAFPLGRITRCHCGGGVWET